MFKISRYSGRKTNGEPDWETIGKCKDCKWWEKDEMLVEDMGFCNRENSQFYCTHEDFSCIHWARRNKDDTEVQGVVEGREEDGRNSKHRF